MSPTERLIAVLDKDIRCKRLIAGLPCILAPSFLAPSISALSILAPSILALSILAIALLALSILALGLLALSILALNVNWHSSLITAQTVNCVKIV